MLRLNIGSCMLRLRLSSGSCSGCVLKLQGITTLGLMNRSDHGGPPCAEGVSFGLIQDSFFGTVEELSSRGHSTSEMIPPLQSKPALTMTYIHA